MLNYLRDKNEGTYLRYCSSRDGGGAEERPLCGPGFEILLTGREPERMDKHWDQVWSKKKKRTYVMM